MTTIPMTAREAAEGRASTRTAALLVLTAGAVLGACGGGSSGDSSLAPTANHPPLADAGQPQVAQAGGLVALKGTGFDPDGDEVSYFWRQTGGIGVNLNDTTSAQVLFEAPGLVDGALLEFELVVSDSKRAPAVDGTQVRVQIGYTPCTVTLPPAELALDTAFYSKFCDANGQPVISSYGVPDRALEWVRYQMLEMLKRLPLAAQEMIRNGSRIAVKEPSQHLTDLPEYRDLYVFYPEQDWDALPGVGAVVGRPVTSTSEENVLCYAEDPYRGFSVFIHEFAHSIHLIGLRTADPTFETRLQQAYETAMASGLWAGTYSATNDYEYWAEGVGIWFDAHWSVFNRPEVIDTREELAQYDDGLYRLIREYFSEDPIAMCPPAEPQS